MHTRQVRFGSQWVLVGVIFFYAVGTVIIARHMKAIDIPKSASGNEFEMPQYLDSSTLTRVHTKVNCVEAVLKKADIEPYYTSGQIKGLRITGLDRISASKNLLIKNGDIISAVDGHSLRSKRQAYGVFKRARTKPSMIVELLRNGKAEVLLFDFQ